MPTAKTAEWDADLPDNLRTTADNLQASLDEFERGIASRLLAQHVQPLRVEVEEISDELDRAASRLGKAEGGLQAAEGTQRTLAERIDEVESASASATEDLQKALRDGLAAAGRAVRDATEAEKAVREQLHESLQRAVAEAERSSEERTETLDLAIAGERERVTKLSEVQVALELDLKTTRDQAEEGSKETERRFAGAEQARKELADSLIQTLGERIELTVRESEAQDDSRARDATALREQIARLQAQLEESQRDAERFRMGSTAELQALTDTDARVQESFEASLNAMRRELEAAKSLRASDVADTAASLAAGEAAREELSVRLLRYHRFAMSLAASGLLVALAALYFLFFG